MTNATLNEAFKCLNGKTKPACVCYLKTSRYAFNQISEASRNAVVSTTVSVQLCKCKNYTSGGKTQTQKTS